MITNIKAKEIRVFLEIIVIAPTPLVPRTVAPKMLKTQGHGAGKNIANLLAAGNSPRKLPHLDLSQLKAIKMSV